MSMFRPSVSTAGRRAGWGAWCRLALALVPFALAGCATSSYFAKSPPDGEALFADATFAAPVEPLDPADAFRLTPAMQDYLDKYIAPAARIGGLRRAISKALYDRGQLKLDYDSSITRTASEAFESREGNCLSLVMMTGAFAKAMGMKVTYQQIEVDDMWSRSSGMYILSGHVNLELEHQFHEVGTGFDHQEIYTIDFVPAEGMPRAQVISEETVLAMFMNNRAAEALVRGHIDDAYWRLRQAIALDRTFLGAYNTLGVVYLRHGDPAHAEAVLKYALKAAPDNPRLLANYAQALGDLGRADEAAAVKMHLAAVEPTPPFYWFVQGQQALHQGDFVKARTLFLKELDRAPDYHEFHYALAVADFELNRLDEARREMALAMDNAVKRSDHDLYSGKLDKINAWRAAAATRSQTLTQ